jgi:hypothetical protein
MAPRKFRQKCEERRWLEAERRNCHQAGERKRRGSHRFDELA